MQKAFTDRKTKQIDRPLSRKEEAFCHYYIELHNGKEAAIKAGYTEHTAVVRASQLLSYSNVQNRITELQEEVFEQNIASANEVMDYFTKVMRGEIQDQFGLDAPLSERTRAAQELARRTVDMDARANGTPDQVVKIQLDWGEDDN